MVNLRQINAENMWDIAELEVHPEQDWLVTSARDGLVEAWGVQASGGHVCPLGIYDGDTPVGFVLFTLGAMPGTDGKELAYEINHLLIDRRFQGRGFGRAGLRLALDYIKTFPFGTAKYCWLGYKPCNKTAEKLYISEGFALTDMLKGDETVAVISLQP